MAKFVLKDAFIEIDGVDLSNRASQVAIETPGDEVDLSAFQGDYREFGQGLKDATITATFFQDFEVSSVDDVLWPLSESGDTFLVKVRGFSTPVSATNPEFRMTSRLFNYSPIAGAVGEASTTEVPFRNASQAGLTRAVS